TAICDGIISRGYDLNIWAYASVDTISPKMLEKMKQAGFKWLAYGIESGSKEVLKGVAKARYEENDIRSVVQMTKDAGINVLGNFMFGLPDDDLESMQATLDLAIELNCEYTNFYATMAYPGSDMYQESLNNNIPLPKIWRGYAAFSAECLPLLTKYLSAREVLSFRDDAFIKFHSNQQYLDMIQQKFGQAAKDNVIRMTSHKLERDLLQAEVRVNR
ncbi:MAG: radical SAM protein, partial [bacterium]